MTSTNGNGQVTRHEAKGRERNFGDPSAAGAKGAAVREQNRLKKLGEARERLENHASDAAATLVDLLDSKDDAQKRMAAVAILDRVLGAPEQTVTHKKIGEWEEKLREWAASLA